MIKIKNENVDPEHVLKLFEITNMDMTAGIQWFLDDDEPDKYDVKHWNEASDDFLQVKELFRPIIIAEYKMSNSENMDIDTIIEMFKYVFRKMSSDDKLASLNVLINSHSLGGDHVHRVLAVPEISEVLPVPEVPEVP